MNGNEKTGIRCKGWISVFCCNHHAPFRVVNGSLGTYKSIKFVHFVDLFTLLWYKRITNTRVRIVSASCKNFCVVLYTLFE